MKTTATLVILVCFNLFAAFGQQKLGPVKDQVRQESDDWPKRTPQEKAELAKFETILKQRALKYQSQRAKQSQAMSTPSPVGTCNIITCGDFHADDVDYTNSWGGPKTAVDGSTYGANVAYNCWNDYGTVDYSEGQYISYSNSDAANDTPGIISPSPNGGGFAIFSYKNESIWQDLSVDAGETYTVCFEIAVIPRYSNSDGDFSQFEPNLSFGIGSGGQVISDPLTYTHNDLNIHDTDANNDGFPDDFPKKLTDATSGNGGYQNPGGWTEIDPYWETVCITFLTTSNTVNVFYQTGDPGRSVILVDGLRLSKEGYAVPPSFTSTVNNNKSVTVCEPSKVNLDDFISSSAPSGSALTWSTNMDPLVVADHLTDTNVTPPGTYYAFYYNSTDHCASPVAQLDLFVSDLDAKIDSKSDIDCAGDPSGSITASGLDGVPPYQYSIDGGSNYQSSGTFNNLIEGNYTITVKDANNCTVEVSTSIISIDKEDPVIKAPKDYTLEGCDSSEISDLAYSETAVTISLAQLQAAIDGGGDASDDIGVVSITYIDETVSSNSCTTVVKRTFTAADACGNTASDIQNIIIQDTTAPTFDITMPSDITVECDAVPAPPRVTGSDACSSVATKFEEERTNGSCDSIYTLTRSWTITDDCGNQTMHTQTITVQDTTSPVFDSTPADLTVECDAVPTADTLTATDNCDNDVTITFDEQRTNGSCDANYTLERTWYATDECGNQTSYTQTITVKDTTSPVFDSTPADLTVECDAVPTADTLTATDNCDNDVTITFDEQRTNGSCDANYTLERTWYATDECGNQTSYTQTITVQDTTSPVFDSTPADLTVECDAVPTADTLTATDNCDNDVTITFDEQRTNGSCDANYTLERTWYATDECGNQTSYTQTITVKDTTSPVFDSTPADLTVECDAVPTADTLTATDNCDNDVTITFDEQRTNGSCDANYTLERTWYATDECGNQTSYTQTITVQDTTSPVFDSTPADVTVECDAVPTADTLTATDNCDNDVTITFDEQRTNGSCDANYTLERTWYATDECGNQTSYTQTITVQDTTSPVFDSTPADVTVECDAVPTADTLTSYR